MNINYVKDVNFDEEMKSGLMREKYGEICIEAKNINIIISALNENFKTNFNIKGQNFNNLDLLIWLNEDDDNASTFQININEKYSGNKQAVVMNQLLQILKEQSDKIEEVSIKRNCEIDSFRVEQLLQNIIVGDVFENIIENIPKLSFIDSETYQRNENIRNMIDELEETLFHEIVNKKIKVNGQGGVLREVKGDWGQYGFYETGVKKNYTNLSLVQKMGARTIRSLLI